MIATKMPIVDLVRMDNDAKCAAAAEMHLGSAKNENFFLTKELQKIVSKKSNKRYIKIQTSLKSNNDKKIN